MSDVGEDSDATVPLEEQPSRQDDAMSINPNPIELRRQQRKLHKDIHLASNSSTAKELGKFRDTNNELWEHVKRMYTFKKMESGDATGAREAGKFA